MTKLVTLLVFCVAIFLSQISDSMAKRRIALIIGNSDYEHIPILNNPSNDANLVASTLKNLGFELIGNGPQIDLSKSELETLIQKFGRSIADADAALFYYAGHGIQVQGSNYLIPVGANPKREADVDFEMIDADLVLRQMEAAGSKLNIMILDACRNNPFGGRGFRSSSSGLAQMKAPEGTIISFATQPGNIALDGEGDNSPYTLALTDALNKPGLDVFRTFNDIGVVVTKRTAGQQQPWLSMSPISGEFYFNNPAENTSSRQQQVIASIPDNSDDAPSGSELSALQEQVERLQKQLDEAKKLGISTAETQDTVEIERPEAPELELSRDEKKELQQRLALLGHDPGPSDGQVGPKTRQAIRAARNKLKLPLGDHIDLVLLQRLKDVVKIDVPKNEEARRFSVGELSSDADARVIRAVKNLPFELKFGTLDGKLYIAALTWHAVDWNRGQQLAESIGGNLVSITSKRENEFVYQLVKGDERFWMLDGIGSAWIGPVIGIRQAPNSREPAGGWRWASGERVTYSNWMSGQPNNWGGNESYAAFMNFGNESERNIPPKTSRWWGDISGPMRGIVIEVD